MEQIQHTDPAPLKPTVIRYAMIGSLIMIAYSLIGQLAGISTHESWAVRTLSTVISVAIFFFLYRSAIISYRDHENNGLVTLGRAFMLTFWITLILSVVGTIFFIIMVNYIDSSILDMAREQAIADLEAKGMSDDEIDQAMGYADMFLGVGFMSTMAFLASVFMGAIVGLVASLIYKKD